MSANLATINRDIQQMKNELLFLRHVMAEDFELSKETTKRLEMARKTPRSAYLSHETVKKRLLQ